MQKTKLLLFIFLIYIVFFLSGCSNPKEPTTKNNLFPTTEEITVTEQESAAESSDFEEVTVMDFNDLPDDIKGTIIPIDSLLLYYTETGNEYDTNNSHMLWRTLQYAFGNFGVNYNRCVQKEYSLRCEPMTVGEFTTAILDGDYLDYPIPEELCNDIWYDSNMDTYFFSVGDRGLSQTEILSYQYLEDHNLKVTARLFAQDDNSTICNGTFYFMRNEYASGVIEPLFYYTVTDAEFTMP